MMSLPLLLLCSLLCSLYVVLEAMSIMVTSVFISDSHNMFVISFLLNKIYHRLKKNTDSS